VRIILTTAGLALRVQPGDYFGQAELESRVIKQKTFRNQFLQSALAQTKEHCAQQKASPDND
jgi:hypothetical protein